MLLVMMLPVFTAVSPGQTRGPRQVLGAHLLNQEQLPLTGHELHAGDRQPTVLAAAVTKRGPYNDRNASSHSSGRRRSGIKVSVGPCSLQRL